MTRVHVGPNGEHIDQIQSTRDVVTSGEVPDHVREQIGAKLRECAEREVWMLDRYPAMRDNLVANLKWLGAEDFAPVRSLFRSPAVILGGGPSLDGYKWAPYCSTYATNQAACALPGATAYVCVESMTAAAPPRFDRAVDIFDATTMMANLPRRDDEECFSFFRSDAAYLGLAERYGVAPIAYGSSVSTAAVAVAARHAAPVIVLVGQDLCIGDDGRYYARGTPNEDLRASFVERGGQWFAEFTKPALGRERAPTPIERVRDRWVTQDLNGVREWLETFARGHKHIRLINASEGGIAIDGWEPMALKDAQAVCKEYDRDAPPKPPRFPDLTGDPVVDLRAVRRWEYAAPECMMWQIEDRLCPRKDLDNEGMMRWSIERARRSAEKIGAL